MALLPALSPNEWRAHFGLAAVQLLFGGYYVITKVALNAGANQIVFAIFRGLIAFSILTPLAYFREKTTRPPMDRHILLTLCFLGFTGIFGNQVLFLVGLGLTNPAYAAALLPSIPVFTFILAVMMRVETLNLQKFEGRTRLAGALICVSGAILMVVFRGPAILEQKELNLVEPMADLTGPFAWLASGLLEFGIDKWQLGTLCIIGNCMCVAIYLVVQAPLLSKYPASWSVTGYSYFFGTVFMIATALILSIESTDWILTQSETLAVCYAGVVASALCYGIMSWSNKILGPTFIGFYSSLLPATSNFLSRIFLGSPIYLGSVVGGVLIIAGLYLVTWATYSERQTSNASATEPLLVQVLSTSDIFNQLKHDLPAPSNSTTATNA